MTERNEIPEVSVSEHVTLSKFDGDVQSPEFEVERLVILDGQIIQHVTIEKGKVVGPVGEGNLTGTEIGRLLPVPN